MGNPFEGVFGSTLPPLEVDTEASAPPPPDPYGRVGSGADISAAEADLARRRADVEHYTGRIETVDSYDRPIAEEYARLARGRAAAAEQRLEALRQRAPVKDPTALGEAGRGFARGTGTGIEMLGGAAEFYGGYVPEPLREATDYLTSGITSFGRDIRRDTAAPETPGFTSLDPSREGLAGRTGRWAAGAMGEGIASSMPTLAAAIFGGLPLGAAVSTVQGQGQMYNSLREAFKLEGMEVDHARLAPYVYTYGTAIGLLDSVTELRALSPIKKAEVVGSMARLIAKRVAEGAAIESATELAQEALEVAGVRHATEGAPRLEAGDTSRLIDAAAAGAVPGAGFGLGRGIRESVAGEPKTEPPPAEPTPEANPFAGAFGPAEAPTAPPVSEAPVTAYHGTPSTFDAFDFNRIGETETGIDSSATPTVYEGWGVYATTDRDEAQRVYAGDDGNVYKVKVDSAPAHTLRLDAPLRAHRGGFASNLRSLLESDITDAKGEVKVNEYGNLTGFLGREAVTTRPNETGMESVLREAIERRRQQLLDFSRTPTMEQYKWLATQYGPKGATDKLINAGVRVNVAHETSGGRAYYVALTPDAVSLTGREGESIPARIARKFKTAMGRQPRNIGREMSAAPVAPAAAETPPAVTPEAPARDVDALGYYSAAIEAAREWKQPRGTPQQAIKYLKSKGVKDAEIEATGLNEFLADKKSVTREELASFLEQNRTRLMERLYDKNTQFEHRAGDIGDIGIAEYGLPYSQLSDQQRGNLESFTKWKEHSLTKKGMDDTNPTYMERVVHLPSNATREDVAADRKTEQLRRRLAAALEDGRDDEADHIQSQLDAMQDRVAFQNQLEEGTYSNQDFRSGHFPQPNIVGHYQASVQLDANGNKVFVPSQIQDDWGQAVRDKGVKDEAKIDRIRTDLKAAQAKWDSIVRSDPGAETRLSRARTHGSVDLLKSQDAAVDTLAELSPKLDRLEAELRTAEAAPTAAHPLVKTTDQWVNTTLRRIIKDAVDSGATSIAIPSGDTVLSYNPGDEHGMQEFYNKIVPKNLGNLLKKMDPSIKGERVPTLRSHDGKKNLGKGFTVFPITDKVKDAVRGGQPMYAKTTAQRVVDMVQKGKPYNGLPSVIREVHQAMRDSMIFPPDVRKYAVAKITRASPDDANITLRDIDGNETVVSGPFEQLRTAGALYGPIRGVPSVISLRLDLAGDAQKSIRAEIAHEGVHALWPLLPADVQTALIDHGNSLGVMKTGLKDAFTRSLYATASEASNSVLLFQAYHQYYNNIYGPGEAYRSMMDQETVAHMLQWYVTGALSPEQVAPVQHILDGMLRGDYARGETSGAVNAPTGPMSAISGEDSVADPRLGFGDMSSNRQDIDAALERIMTIRGSFSPDTRHFIDSHPVRFLKSVIQDLMSGRYEASAQERSAIDNIRPRLNDINEYIAAYRMFEDGIAALERDDRAQRLIKASREPRPIDARGTVYHGSPDQFDKYSGDIARTKSQAAKDAQIDVMWVTPEKSFAERFGGAKKLTLDSGFYFDPWDDRDLARLAPYINKQPNADRLWSVLDAVGAGTANWGLLERAETLKELKRLGYDGVKMRENWHDDDDRQRTSTTIAVFSPGKVLRKVGVFGREGIMFAISGEGAGRPGGDVSTELSPAAIDYMRAGNEGGGGRGGPPRDGDVMGPPPPGDRGPPLLPDAPRIEAEANRSFADRMQSWVKTVNEWWSPIEALPDVDAYRLLRYRAKGKIGDAQEASVAIYKRFAKASQADKEASYKYLTTRDANPFSIADPNVREAAVYSKQIIDWIGQSLVDRGMISEDSYQKFRGEYLPRLYLKHIVKNGRIVDAMASGTRPSKMPYTKERNEALDAEVRALMGEIKDVGFLASRGVLRPMRDIALIDFLNQVAGNDQWVFRDGLVDYKGRKASPYYLRSEAIEMRDRAALIQQTDPTNAQKMLDEAAMMDAVASTVIGKEENVPDGYARIADSPRYGMLRGMLVRKEIKNDILGSATIVPEDADFITKAFRPGGPMQRMVGRWKSMKVTMNPSGQIRNVIGNKVMMHIAGMTPEDIRKYRQMAEIEMATPKSQFIRYVLGRDRLDKGPIYRHAKTLGLKATGFSESELNKVNREFLSTERKLAGLKNFGIARAAGVATRQGLDVVMEKAGDAYQHFEAKHKIAMMLWGVDKLGMTPDEAYLNAQKWLFDYDEVPGIVRRIRSSPFGLPFITFFYKSIPRVIEATVQSRGAALAPYIVLPYFLMQAFGALWDVGDDDVEKLKKAVPEYLRRKNSLTIIPWKDDKGRWQFFDYGYLLPWSMPQEAADALVSRDLNEFRKTVGLFGAPGAQVIMAIGTGIDPFTGRPIMNKADPPEKKIADLASYMWRMAMPPWITDQSFVKKIADAVNEKVMANGDPPLTITQAFLRGIGFNVYPIEPEISRERELSRMKWEIADIKRRQKFRTKDQSLTDKEIDKINDEYDALIQKKQDEMDKYDRDSDIHPNLRTERKEPERNPFDRAFGR